jgi:hypothetical protein
MRWMTINYEKNWICSIVHKPFKKLNKQLTIHAAASPKSSEHRRPLMKNLFFPLDSA